jgi:hypothetical protein
MVEPNKITYADKLDATATELEREAARYRKAANALRSNTASKSVSGLDRWVKGRLQRIADRALTQS